MARRYVALVRGPRAIFPRGFLWIVPLWYAVAAIALATRSRLLASYGLILIGMLALAAAILLAVLLNLRCNAFLADDDGISLGLRAAAARHRARRRRRNQRLPWSEIEQVSIAARPYGALVAIRVSEQSAAARAGSEGWRIAASALTLVLPPCYLFRMPGLLQPRTGSACYPVPLWDVVPGDACRALAELAPASVPVVVKPTLRARALGRLRRPAQPVSNAPA
jgi:hypothetical protein